MRKIVHLLVLIVFVIFLLCGCVSSTVAVNHGISYQDENSSPINEIPKYKIILSNPPEDFIVDEKYGGPLSIPGTTVKYDRAEDAEPEVVSYDATPSIDVYTHMDADGVLQFRVYGEKYKIISTHIAKDGTVKEVLATEAESIGTGMYDVDIDMQQEEKSKIIIKSDSPVPFEKENFSQ